MSPIAYIIHNHWKNDSSSGVGTFVRQIHDGLEAGCDCVFIERPIQTQGVGEQVRATALKESSFRMVFGYLQMLLADVRFVISNRRAMSGRSVVTNDFGCETLPIALRIVRPLSRIVAIAHSHPGQDKAAQHPVRALIEHICLYCVTEVIFNSESLKKQWMVKLGTDHINGQVIHHGMGKPDLSVPPDYPVRVPGITDLLFVGSFYSWKGQMAMLVAWTEVARKMIPARLVFVGDGMRFTEARQFVVDNKLDNSVIFLGAKANGATYFNCCDIGVLLSMEPEAFGLVLLEAMSRGKPVLASRLGGILEVVESGETGLLVDPHSPVEVAAAVAVLVENRAMSDRMGVKGRERWRKFFSRQRMLDDYIRLFATR